MPGQLSVFLIASITLNSSLVLAGNLPTIPIADFCCSIQTQQGGYYRCIGGQPNQIFDELTTCGQPEVHAWRIGLTTEAASKGVGILIPLFDETEASSIPFRIGRGYYLSGRFLGQLGQRQLRIELVLSQNPEAAGLKVGTLEAKQFDGKDWTEVRLPIPRDANNARHVAFIRIIAEGQGEGWFAIDSLQFSSNTIKAMSSKPTTARSLRKALWHWETEETLADGQRSAALLELCQAQGITDLYCQIPYAYEDGRIHLRLVDKQRAFNAAAEARGITTHALDGSPDYVFSKNHSRMIRLISALGSLNEQALSNERYQAVHLDNEPYVLPDWKDDGSRQQLIRDYIELHQKLRLKADEYGMELGVDIPFWWDACDREGLPRFTYDTETGKQPMLDALFPLLDNVGIMSYRERVTGPNGLVYHCLNEFELAEKYDVDVYAALELGTGADVEAGTSFGVYPWPYFHGQLKSLETILSCTPGCAGIAIHHAKPFVEAMK